MVKHSQTVKHSRASETAWEGVALLAVLAAISVIPLSPVIIPVLNNALAKQDPEDIFVTMLIQENGGFDPDVIRVTVDQNVRLILLSQDVIHSFIIPKLGIDSGPAYPMKPIILEFTPTQIGVYDFYCGIYCTPSHWEMTGKLIVEPPG
ncbi:MAG: cupredoxin domain-containing protein [Candidatus Heimdallarchaeota archaeon]